MSDIRFVAQTGTRHDDSNTRRGIRRHVMLGRNQGQRRDPKRPDIEGAAVFRLDDWQWRNQPIPSVVPRRVGTDFSFLDFADTVEPPLVHDTLRFCNATNEILYVLEPCIAFDSTDIASTCIQALAHDALHLHVMVFSAQAYMALRLRQTQSQQRGSSHGASLEHYGKALSLLRKRLAEAEQKRSTISDLNVMSILPLAMQALFVGEHESARNHMAGVRRLVSMREGGIHSFSAMTKQMIEILRCDISLSLAAGQAPAFFSEPAYEPMFPLPELAIPGKRSANCSLIVKSELAEIWEVLFRFCAMVNEAAIDQRKIPEQILLETMASVMYRLFDVSVVPESADDTMRLAMLSFCATIFLPWQDLQMPFGWLRLEHKRRIAHLMQPTLAHSDPLMVLWFLNIYGIAFSPLHADERKEFQTWLNEVADICELTTWDGVKNAMRDFLWIDMVCDHRARKLRDESLTERVAAKDL